MSTLEDIMSTFWGDIMMHLEDTMSTLGDIMSTSGGYHEYIRGCSVHLEGVQYIGGYHEYTRGS